MTRKRLHMLLDYLLDSRDIKYKDRRTKRVNTAILASLSDRMSIVINKSDIMVRIPTEDIKMSDEDEGLMKLQEAAPAMPAANTDSSYLGGRERTGYNS